MRTLGPGLLDVDLLDQVAVRVADLPGSALGWTFSRTIWIDADAAGHGWFVGRTGQPSRAVAEVAERLIEEVDGLTNGGDFALTQWRALSARPAWMVRFYLRR